MVCVHFVDFFSHSINFGPVNLDDKKMIKNYPDTERPMKKQLEKGFTQKIKTQYILKLIIKGLKVSMQNHKHFGNCIRVL